MVDAGLLPGHTKFATPSSAKLYEKYERIFVDYACEAGYTTAELDLQWWTKYSKQPTGVH
jgi:thermostable 8-oxoguanine DNA glycosylase